MRMITAVVLVALVGCTGEDGENTGTVVLCDVDAGNAIYRDLVITGLCRTRPDAEVATFSFTMENRTDHSMRYVLRPEMISGATVTDGGARQLERVYGDYTTVSEIAPGAHEPGTVSMKYTPCRIICGTEWSAGVRVYRQDESGCFSYHGLDATQDYCP